MPQIAARTLIFRIQISFGTYERRFKKIFCTWSIFPSKFWRWLIRWWRLFQVNLNPNYYNVIKYIKVPTAYFSGYSAYEDKVARRKSVISVVMDKAVSVDNRIFSAVMIGIFIYFFLLIVVAVFLLSVYIWLKYWDIFRCLRLSPTITTTMRN